MAKARDIPGLHGTLPFAEAARATVAIRAQEIFDHSEGVLDTADIERVHAMRVATRRLRAVLEIYRPCFDEDRFKPVLRDVKALADALGLRRDPDVQLDALTAFAACVADADRPGIEVFARVLREEQREGNVALAAALEEMESSDLRGRIAALIAEDEPEPEPEPEPEQAPAEPAADDEHAAASSVNGDVPGSAW